MTLFLKTSSRLDDPINVDNTTLFTPNVTNTQSLEAFIGEAIEGVDTRQADMEASNILQAGRSSEPYSFDDYAKTDYAKQGVKWFPEINEKSAQLLLERQQKTQARAEIIANSTTGQAAMGFAAALAVGTFEPKNMLYGAAGAALVGPFVGEFGPMASSLKRIGQLRQAGQRLGMAEYRALAGAGAVEGMVSASIMEPSNRYSAKILQEDYTAADTMWNIATSTLFGTAVSVAPSFIRDRFAASPNRAMQNTVAEFDTAVSQVAAGQKVDVSHVELTSLQRELVHVLRNDMRDITNAQKLSDHIAEHEARLSVDAPDLVATNRVLRRIMDDYQATIAEAEAIQAQLQQTPVEALDPVTAERIAFLEAELEKPNLPANLRQAIESERAMLEAGTPFKETETAMLSALAEKDAKQMRGKLVKLSKLQKRIDKKMNEFTAQAQPFFDLAKKTSNDITQKVNQNLVRSTAAENDTAIDIDAINAANEVHENLLALTPNKQLANYMDTLNAMKSEGLISDADMQVLNDAMASLNETDLQNGYNVLAGCLIKGES